LFVELGGGWGDDDGSADPCVRQDFERELLEVRLPAEGPAMDEVEEGQGEQERGGAMVDDLAKGGEGRGEVIGLVEPENSEEEERQDGLAVVDGAEGVDARVLVAKAQGEGESEGGEQRAAVGGASSQGEEQEEQRRGGELGQHQRVVAAVDRETCGER
jgi:hypothetical protein